MSVDISNLSLVLLLVGLIAVSGFFSSSETGMMALNIYKLKHLARSKHRAARIAVNMLKRPDRLLGVILIGNTLANNLASIIAIKLANRYIADAGLAVTVVSIGLTLGLLIFAEVGPKTIAALYPLRLALVVTYPLRIILWILYPIVWLVNFVANSLLRLLGIKAGKHVHDVGLNAEELKTILNEAGELIPSAHQNMLLQILNLEKESVDDIMIPKSEIYGIDLSDSETKICEKLKSSPYARVPIYLDHIDNIKGMVNIRKIIPLLSKEHFSKRALLKVSEDIYFIPEGTALTTQLLYFRKAKQRAGIVVDEYGDIQGLVVLEDILEEIVGEFTTNVELIAKGIYPQADGSYVVDGAIHIAKLNKKLKLSFSLDGPKTLSGLLIEYLETIPSSRTCVMLQGYPIEILTVTDNTIKTVRISPSYLQTMRDKASVS